MAVISLAEMLESGVHFGHQTRRWNPKMSPYIYTERNGVHIIDLVQTAELMEEAYDYVRSSSEDGKKFLFVGTKRQAAGIIASEAARCGGYYVNQRWLGGMLTNWATIKTRVDRLKTLEDRESSGYFDYLPKKEDVYTKMEALIWHFKIIMGEIDLPKGQIYCPVEGGNGELGFYLISDGGRTPFRLHFRRPCFIYYQAYPELIKGGMLSDAVVTMSSLNLIAGELDA